MYQCKKDFLQMTIAIHVVTHHNQWSCYLVHRLLDPACIGDTLHTYRSIGKHCWLQKPPVVFISNPPVPCCFITCPVTRPLFSHLSGSHLQGACSYLEAVLVLAYMPHHLVKCFIKKWQTNPFNVKRKSIWMVSVTFVALYNVYTRLLQASFHGGTSWHDGLAY